MRLYRYTWRHDCSGWLAGLTVLHLDIPALGLKAEITRHKPGWHHWLRIRRESENLPLVAVSGPIRVVFAVIREFVEVELGKKVTGWKQ